MLFLVAQFQKGSKNRNQFYLNFLNFSMIIFFNIFLNLSHETQHLKIIEKQFRNQSTSNDGKLKNKTILLHKTHNFKIIDRSSYFETSPY